ncbi:MAG: N-acetyltransferase [Thalassobaculaceae bacterium]
MVGVAPDFPPAIRDTGPEDGPGIDALYRAAFPEEDLRPLVTALMREPTGVISLAAVDGEEMVGHVAFTECGIPGRLDRVALLGPLAVAPHCQRRGIGRSLVRAGLDRLAGRGVVRVCVLGDSAFYARLGFAPETAIAPPYALPRDWLDAWQSIDLAGSDRRPEGRLSVPPLWQQPDLWSA